MAVTPSMILGKWLAEAFFGKKNNNTVTELTDTQRIQIYEMTMLEVSLTDYVVFQHMNLSTPEQEQVAQQITTPRDKKDEIRVYRWTHALRIEIIFMDNPLGRKEEREELIKKMYICIDNLLKSNDQNWKYWFLYAKINSMEICKNPEEASIGFKNANKLMWNALKEFANTREEKLADQILYTRRMTPQIAKEVSKSRKKWLKYTLDTYKKQRITT